MSYGIGRVPADMDATSEAIAELEAQACVARVIRYTPATTPAKSRVWKTCRRCRQGGYVGSYPFSTAPNSGLCDDCG